MAVGVGAAIIVGAIVLHIPLTPKAPVDPRWPAVTTASVAGTCSTNVSYSTAVGVGDRQPVVGTVTLTGSATCAGEVATVKLLGAGSSALTEEAGGVFSNSYPYSCTIAIDEPVELSQLTGVSVSVAPKSTS